MTKTILIVSFLLFSSLNLEASLPTMESLFRNGSNQDIGSKSVDYKFMVESQILNTGNTDDNAQLPVWYGRYVFHTEDNGKEYLYQTVFSDEKMKNESMVDIKWINSWPRLITRAKDTPSFSRFFYSFMSSLLLNRSDLISIYLSSIDGSFKTNKSSINNEKIRLYEKYKVYLKKLEEEKESSTLVTQVEAGKEVLENPLKLKDQEEQEKIEKILNSSYYGSQENVQLVKNKNDFFWMIKLNNMEAKFENESRQLKELRVTESNEWSVIFRDYILFNGVHELPKNIYIYKDGQLAYKVKSLSLKHYNLSESNIKNLKKRILKIRKEQKDQLTGAPSPFFL